MKIKPLKQTDSIACGPTSIKMVCNYFDTPHTLNQIKEITKYRQRDGLTNSQLEKALQALGFKTETRINATWNDLKKYNTKERVIVLSWMYKGYIGHFSVLEKTTATHISLADPETGKIVKMPKMQFMRLWHDYDSLWFPLKNTDIQLRWMLIVSK